ncbi:hypothetical protein Tco_1412360, partial [Tanacetum coccineum]
RDTWNPDEDRKDMGEASEVGEMFNEDTYVEKRQMGRDSEKKNGVGA